MSAVAFRLVPLFFLFAGFLSGQQVEVHFDEKKVGKEEGLVVEVLVEGQDPGVEFQTKDFEVQDGDRGSQIQIINGQVRKFNRYHFHLVPQRVGNLSFSVACGPVNKGPFTVEVVEGRLKRERAANPIEELFGNPMEAMGLARASIGADEVLLRNEISTASVYSGQVFFLDNVLYLRTEVQQPGLVKDDTHNGFTAEQIRDHGIANAAVVLNGQPYNRVVLRRKAMFSLLPGPATIKGWTLRFRKGNGLFVGPPKDISAPDVNLTVLALPESGKPASFKGAVGEFTLETRLNPRALKTHEAATLSYVISGKGQARTLVLPAYGPSDPDLQSRRSRTEDRFKLGPNGWEGSLLVEYLLIPTREKNYQVPALPWSYFSPARGTYVTLSTAAQTLSATRTPGQVDDPSRKDNSREVESIRDDIRYLRVGPTGNQSKDTPFWISLFFYLAGGLLSLAAGGLLAKQHWFDRSPRQKRVATSRWALKQILSFESGDLKTQARQIEDLIRQYLSEVFGISSGIPLNELSPHLAPHFDEEDQTALVSIIRQCQAVRYGGPDLKDLGGMWARAKVWFEKQSSPPVLPKATFMVFVLFVCLLHPLFSRDDAPALKAAFDFYGQGQYLQAYKIYDDQIRLAGPSSDLLYQRACAATRVWGDTAVTQHTGYLAQALRDFSHSAHLKSQPDVAYNLSFLKAKISDQIVVADPPLFSMVLFFYYYLFPTWALFIFGGLFCFLGSLFFLGWVLLPNPFGKMAKWSLPPALVLTLLFSVSGLVKHWQEDPSRLAWIRLDAVDLKNGPTPQGQVLLVLHEGTEVKPLREVDGFVEVRLADNRQGWLPAEALLK